MVVENDRHRPVVDSGRHRFRKQAHDLVREERRGDIDIVRQRTAHVIADGTADDIRFPAMVVDRLDNPFGIFPFRHGRTTCS